MPRGSINNPDRARQLNDFSGLRFGKITPTDIDGLIEYHNKAYVLIETKYKAKKLPSGQELALKRLTEDLNRKGKPTLCIIAQHEVEDPTEPVNVASTQVRSYKYTRDWVEPCKGTVFYHVSNFFNKIDKIKSYSPKKPPIPPTNTQFNLAGYMKPSGDTTDD